MNPPACANGEVLLASASSPNQDKQMLRRNILSDPTTIVEQLFLIVNTYLHVLCNLLYKIFPPQQSEGEKQSVSDLVVLPIPAIPPVGDTLKL